MNLGKYEINNIYNEDCYEALKNLPDKSIDLVYIDPPYQFCQGGKGHGDLADRRNNNNKEIYSLDTDITKRKIGTGYTSGGGCFGTKKRDYHSEIQQTDVNLTPERKAYLDYVEKYGKDEEAERLRVIANAIDNKQNTYFISKGFSNEILDELCRIMKKIYIYIWCNKEQLRQIIDYFDDKGCHIDLLTWHKTNPIPTCNNTYLSDTEYLVMARESGCKIYGSVETKHKYYVSQCNITDKDLYDHPTIKPLDFVKDHIFNSTVEGDIVLDCFMGSGTTAVACKELGRNFIGFELNPKYWQIAVDRVNGIDNRTGNMREDGKATLGDIYEWANGKPDTKVYEERIAQNKWRGWNTQLKPSYEPVIVAQKPIEKSIVDNVMKYGVGGINIDECRVETTDKRTIPINSEDTKIDEENLFGALHNNVQRERVETDLGRFPSNVIHDGSDEVVNLFPDSKSTGSDYNFESSNQDNTTHLYTNIKSGKHFEDEGSCARFFYTAKASRFDRDEGLDDLESKRKYVDTGTRKPEGKSIMEGSNVVAKNIHPTCKPCDLMRYLVRLVSPKGATILDCFNGSGSTGKAVMLENKQYHKDYKYIGIELTEEYLPIAKARIEYICNNEFDFWKDENGKEQRQVKDKDVITIFDFDVEES